MPRFFFQVEDIEIWTHTYETLASVRKQILNRVKVNPATVKLELYVNSELIDPRDDQTTLYLLPEIKDKCLVTGKLCQLGGNLVSSPDSSSGDSSTSCSPRRDHGYDGPNVEVEQGLPGVIMSQSKEYCQFLLQLADLGTTQKNDSLRSRAHHCLKLMPADSHTVNRFITNCADFSGTVPESKRKSPQQIWDSFFFSTNPSQTLYNLEVCYSLLMPSSAVTTDKTFEFQMDFIKAMGIPAVDSMLTRNNFLADVDLLTKKSAYLCLLKMCKLLFAIAGHSLVHMVAEACQPDSATQIPTALHNQAVVLQQALHQIPNAQSEIIVRNTSQRLAQQLLEKGAKHLPNESTVQAIIRLAWSTACGNINMMNGSTSEELHAKFQNPEDLALDDSDIDVCKEALEVLTLAIALCPTSLESLSKDQSWQNFIIDLTLMNNVKGIRQTAAEQFHLIATRCSGDQHPIRFFTTLLFTVLDTTVPDNASQCSEYFQLLSRLLAFASATSVAIPTTENSLNREIKWLKNVKVNVAETGT